MATQDVDPALVEAFRPIAKDLGQAGLRAELRPESGTVTADFDAAGLRVPAPPLRWAAIVIEGESWGTVSIDPQADAAMDVRLLAEQIQDLVLEFARQDGEATVWPACQHGHRHPMRLAPLPVEGGAPDWPAWTCPTDPGHRTPVGELE